MEHCPRWEKLRLRHSLSSASASMIIRLLLNSCFVDIDTTLGKKCVHVYCGTLTSRCRSVCSAKEQKCFSLVQGSVLSERAKVLFFFFRVFLSFFGGIKTHQNPSVWNRQSSTCLNRTTLDWFLDWLIDWPILWIHFNWIQPRTDSSTKNEKIEKGLLTAAC